MLQSASGLALTFPPPTRHHIILAPPLTWTTGGASYRVISTTSLDPFQSFLHLQTPVTSSIESWFLFCLKPLMTSLALLLTSLAYGGDPVPATSLGPPAPLAAPQNA